MWMTIQFCLNPEEYILPSLVGMFVMQDILMNNFCLIIVFPLKKLIYCVFLYCRRVGGPGVGGPGFSPRQGSQGQQGPGGPRFV